MDWRIRERLMNADKFDIRKIAEDIHANAVEKGFWEEGKAGPQDVGHAIALMHSELSEAYEAWRKHNKPSDKIPEFSGVEEELADTVIRILDFCEGHRFDLVGAILAKMKFNRDRPYRHGGKQS